MKTLTLIKARLRGSGVFSRDALSELKRTDRLWLLPVAGAGIAAALSFFLISLIGNYRLILQLGLEAGSPEDLLLLSGIMSSILIFFIGTPLALSGIFYSKDNSLLAGLPVTKTQIAASRLSTLYLFLLPLHLLIVLPALVIYFSALGISAAGLAAGAVQLLFGSFIPITAALLASAALAAGADLSGHRTAFEVAGMTIAIVLLGALQLIIGRQFTGDVDPGKLAHLLSGAMGALAAVFPLHDAAAKGFAAGGGLYTGLFTAVSVAAAAAVLRLTVRLFGRGLTGRDEKPAKKKNSRRKAGAALSPARRPELALLRREWLIISSNSTFLFEAFGEILILPILLVIFTFTIPDGISEMLSSSLAGFRALPLVVFAALILFGSINSVSSTSISREGESFRLSKSFPVPGRVQVKAKMLFHLLLFMSSWYINLIILFVFLKIDPVHLLYMIPGAPAVTLFIFIINIKIDMGRPVLKWTHPGQAMKQNMNVLLSMGTGLLSFGAVAGAGAGLTIAGAGPLATGLIVTAAMIAADAVLLPKLFNYADRRYGEIEM